MKAGRLSTPSTSLGVDDPSLASFSTSTGLGVDQMASLASFLGGGGGSEPKLTITKKIGKEKKELELTAKNILPSAKWDFTFPNWSMRNNCYGDIVWTPQLGEEKRAAEKKEWALARAVFNVIQFYGGGPVQMTHACSHYSVQNVKKEPSFKSMKMVDFVRLYPDVFEVSPDPTGGGFQAKLVPGAEAALPGDPADALTDEGNEMMKSLPKFLLDPQTPADKIQALRIEIIHSLANRGSKLALTDIGQDPRVQQAKSKVSAQKKVTEFIRMFPANFSMTEFPTMEVELSSTDVSDQSAIPKALKSPAFRDTPGFYQGSGPLRTDRTGGPAPRFALPNAPAPRRSPPRRSPPRRSPPRGRSPRGRSPKGRRERSRSRRRRERSRSRSRRGRDRDR
eukprot:TRINITY_DN10949_c0_g2_i3.p1 TRINITY_DN10949_c0_g2~~TRINITY_DN10949_c0_g2_i3.p1  ORF type:complete len:431 (-),score=48.23 TRINITY_DN10949_c0_g2_i3:84-1265(-)